ncbi:minor capsid protein [Clostridium sp.]|mgnify:CR=1 FL=1|uniref:minor capsid protein n=1 Tax=Clostridium sp. TaxID=1506 RepID=UPI002907711B|nr:minor capsid protein [Clostridium sp.]MDU4726385.1 minor capsid protein [Clostridium sp.]
MNNQEYWEERQALNYSNNEKDIVDFYKDLISSFEKSKKEVQKVIKSFYLRYADNNGVSFGKAQELLSKEEIGELKDYIMQVYATMGIRDFNVINKSIKARITRYEALLKQIQAIIDVLYEVDYKERGIEKFKEIYKKSYYNTLYNIDVFNGFHTEFSILNIRDIETLVEYPFNGANYSDRIWKQKDHMITKLKENITTMLVQGKNPDTLSSEFAKVFKTKEYEAYRLLHTESSFIIEQGTLKAYQEDGVTEYQILATLDIKTSNICREQDNKVYKIDEYITGSTAPPFHYFCRTTTVPYYGEDEGTRKARDPVTNKSYEIAANMSYEEWYDKYIRDNPEALLEEKKWKNRNTDKKQYKKYKEVLGKETPKSLKDFQELKYNNSDEWNKLKSNYIDIKRYNKIVENSSNLNIKGIPIKNIDRIDLKEYEFDYHHINNERNHGVTKEMAQEFINSSKAAYSRWNGQVVVYVSENGCSVVNLKDKKVSTSYKNEEYDDKFKKLMEVLKDD